ncbi:nuclear transport factor 2 family protein [Amycolatopsis sp. 195334CR]|uniref:nuclear transport factor 2 family protein n=1 Tax=Amycolatopsis sp. 195334CR TaxID=2814588 RepID=UPI001A906135|nr:nuclear transport factor 2 family protein [Amycolatopsis sp. 195334CR]MBN6041440.1 nuclear transport factor 2 family protein [Amycolatopsis sp. 195334CR]
MRAWVSAFAATAALAVLATPAGASSRFEELPENVRTFMTAYTAWGDNPRDVDAYLDLFVSDGSARLWDSGLAKPIDTTAGIRAQIEGVNRLVPDYRFVPERATASPDGKVAFVEATNTGTINGKPVAFTTMHRLVFGDPETTRVQDGRRSWDQVNLFAPVADAQHPLPNLFEGITSTPVDSLPGIDLPVYLREKLWRHEKSDALVAGHPGTASLSGPGLATPLTGRKAVTAYLDRFFGTVSDLRLEPGTTVRSGGTTYQEWLGTTTAHGGGDARPVPFSLVERIEPQRWSLYFDTLDLVASRETVAVLRQRIFG